MMNIKPILPEKSHKFQIIAGPCSAESEEQILTAAQALSKHQEVDFLRASVWKPRTFPGDFEGVGAVGLEWLRKAKAATGLKTCTEVAHATHVEQAVKSGIDMVWIGARTTVNPFLVEEIAEAVAEYGVPVMVKNPVNPDIDLWIGAIERFIRKGANQIGAIHRGFSGYRKLMYRNEPFWEVVFELKRRYPTLPVINDPSHLTGDKALVPAMCQKALDLEADGLMIEVHPCPENALTDKQQQLTFADFANLLKTLTYRNPKEDIPSADMLKIRTQIDEADFEIIKHLAHRMELVREIGNVKRRSGMTILQMERWKDVVETRLALGDTAGLERDFLLKILQTIHEEALRVQ
ncbi:MAG: bifunctional 3-deoxy-7-phosphoheptulonate synthase/chorismate mutase type II [Bacteroidales bacterium]|nr:bifunctional 3-deoxy-7-phosphoheptulonate synthase/chorismate mutase type II [Bacteroidales bacterium]